MRSKIVLPKWTGIILFSLMYGALAVTSVAAFYATKAIVNCFLPACSADLMKGIAYLGVGSVLVPASLALLYTIIDLLSHVFELEHDPDEWDDC